VNRQARRWAAAAALLLLVAGGALAFGQASGTFAIFTAETENPNAVFQGSWIPPIASTTSSLVASGSFNQAQLSWTLGAIPSSGNPITGYSLEYAPGGSGGSASCGTYGAFSTPASSPVSVTGTDISQWWCFQIHATSATVWTSQTVAFTPRRLFTPINTVAFSEHGGTAGSIEQLDQIAITFNQAPSNPGTIAVTTTAGTGTGTITIAGVGTITGLTIGNARNYAASTSSVAGNTLTIVVNGGSGVSSHSTNASGTGTFTGSSSFTSSGGQNLCTAAACTVQTSGSF
jgi:hypothetical protein